MLKTTLALFIYSYGYWDFAGKETSYSPAVCVRLCPLNSPLVRCSTQVTMVTNPTKRAASSRQHRLDVHIQAAEIWAQ